MSAPAPFLVLNTAEGLLQAAFAGMRDGVPRLEAWAERKAESRGAELLVPLIRETAAKAHITPSALRGIAAVRGPGSFTGLRLAPATAAGLARASGALMAGLDYLPLLALSALLRGAPAEAPRVPRRIWVLVHARKKLLYAQAFDVKERATAKENVAACLALPDGGIRLLAPEEAATLIGADAQGPRPELTGSGIRNNLAAFASLIDTLCGPGRAAPALLLPPEYDNPAPEALLLAAASAQWSREDVVPWYFRPPDAEENLAASARALGLDPEAARARLARLRDPLPQD
ncbi:MAG: tRNA (adenosine(37)-N6)-threonylcarbamoyltransferase complex dimerization subunit type 1 TsaB [Desulfovibrio sp.]|nr:tRNA (adenosine(37)-N6)-threonylcarbamoyltransferase complex dimerization subunit type 1 TsaB [Desulfovibrio sp.]